MSWRRRLGEHGVTIGHRTDDAVGLRLLFIRQPGQPEPQETGQRVSEIHRAADHRQGHAEQRDNDRIALLQRILGAVRKPISDGAKQWADDQESDRGLEQQAIAGSRGVGQAHVGHLGLELGDSVRAFDHDGPPR